jgi:hypothetical protein
MTWHPRFPRPWVGLVLAFVLGPMVEARAQVVSSVVYLTDTTGQPTFDRPDNGEPPTTLSGNNVSFVAADLNVPVAGNYQIYSFGVDPPPSWDNAVTIYNGPFNPADPLTNAQFSNDDLGDAGVSGTFDLPLSAGSAVVVHSGFDTPDAGLSLNAIIGPGVVTASGAGVTVLSSLAYQGTTVDGPTFNRPVENGLNPPNTLSNTATAVAFSEFAFNVDQDGLYGFMSAGRDPEFWDNYTVLYAGAFDPDNPLLNAVVANDDNPFVGFSGFSGLEVDLTAGIYTLVTTGFDNDDAGAFTNVIFGPAGSSISAVPEPSTLVLSTLVAIGIGWTAVRARRRRVVNAASV